MNAAEQLSSWLQAWTERVRTVGVGCALGGDASWDALLAELGVPALPVDERRRHVQEGPKRVRGALPIEVRRAIEAIETRARAALRTLDHQGVDDAALEPIERSLVGLVDAILRDHLRATGPAITTASIFANAMATTPTAYAGVGPSLSTLKCTTCGGPRRAGGELAPCPYCGGSLA